MNISFYLGQLSIVD